MRLGLPKGLVDVSVRNLFEHIVEAKGLAPTTNWQLSPSHDGEPLAGVLTIQHSQDSYVLTVPDQEIPWKLLIKDPLTLLQIKREGWHLQCDSLILNLVRKGLSFQILYPYHQTGIVFHNNPGPVIHPDGKYPTHTDYLAYRLDVADFFRFFPHAHVAALCTGGILWRIAIDVLAIPPQQDFIRPFHPRACETRFIGGQQYWTPTLLPEDEEMIVGTYKWAGKSNARIRRMCFANKV
jgi:hypothetical protein